MPTDPLKLRIGGQDFDFSIESALDVKGTDDDSGHYNMNVNSSSSSTNTTMLVKEVQVYRGKLSSRIDVFFLQLTGIHSLVDYCRNQTQIEEK